MKRLAICVTVTLALGLLSAPLSSEAQPAAKVPRVGYLSAGTAVTSTVEVFRQRLRELGYTDGSRSQGVEMEAMFSRARRDQVGAHRTNW